MTKFPARHSQENITAQKRLAQQFMVQMPKDAREQKEVVRYLLELIEWQERQNGDGKTSPAKKT